MFLKPVEDYSSDKNQMQIFYEWISYNITDHLGIVVWCSGLVVSPMICRLSSSLYK